METIKTISALSAFERVARLQSFTQAAKELGVSKAYISKLIQSLEEELGERLFLRSTRKVRLTIIGESLFNQCTDPISRIEQIKNELLSVSKTPRGIFKVSVAGAFGEEFIAPILLELTQQYPELKVTLTFSTRKVDLIEENYDVAIRVGQLSDNNLVARKIRSRKEFICATRSYLEKWGTPHRLEDLINHNCLLGASDSWRFVEKGEIRTIRVSGNFRSNNGRVLLEGALRGIGLVKLPDLYVTPYLESGELVSILDMYMPKETPVWVLTHTKKSNSINLKAFWEILEKRLLEKSGGK